MAGFAPQPRMKHRGRDAIHALSSLPAKEVILGGMPINVTSLAVRFNITGSGNRTMKNGIVAVIAFNFVISDMNPVQHNCFGILRNFSNLGVAIAAAFPGDLTLTARHVTMAQATINLLVKHVRMVEDDGRGIGCNGGIVTPDAGSHLRTFRLILEVTEKACFFGHRHVRPLHNLGMTGGAAEVLAATVFGEVWCVIEDDPLFIRDFAP